MFRKHAFAIFGALAAGALFVAATSKEPVVPSKREEVERWLSKQTEDALRWFDWVDPSILDTLIEGDLLTDEQKMQIQRLRGRVTS